MQIERIRNVNAQELRDWRRNLGKGVQRATITRKEHRHENAHEVDAVEGNQVYVSAPARPGVLRDAREVRDALMDRRWESLKRLAAKDPEWFTKFAEHMRQQNPGLVGHLTNEEIVKTIWEQQHKAATQEAFRKLNRNGVQI